MVKEEELFESYEALGLEEDGEEVPEKDTPLGRDYVRDDGHDVHDSEREADPSLYTRGGEVDVVENRSRNHDFESTPGRVRIGGEGELDISRVDVDSTGRTQGSPDTWSGSGQQATRGYVSDTRGGFGQQNRASEDIDEETHRDLRDAGLKLGIGSVNTWAAGFAMAQAKFAATRRRWNGMSTEQKQATYETRKEQRANRDFYQVREDSEHRKYLEHYGDFVADREAEDPEWWLYGDPEEIERRDHIDQRSARQIAVKWRHDEDVKKLDAFIVRYAAFLEGIKPASIRQRYRRKPHEKELAEFVFSVDLQACGCALPGGFDADELLAAHGDELAMQMNTPRSELERRDFIIKGADDLFSGGSLFPPYIYAELDEMLDAVVAVLVDAGVDMSAPKQEIDWSKV